MGKPKKATQDHDQDNNDDMDNGEVMTNDITKNDTTQPSAKADKKKNKKKGKQKDDDWDDIESELQAMTLEANKGNEDVDDDDVPVAPKKAKNKKKGASAFAMLADLGDEMDDGGGDHDSEKSEDEDTKDKEEIVITQKPKKKEKEKSKKEKAKKQEDEDIDAILADIEKPTKAEKKKKKKNKGVDAEEENNEDEPDTEVVEVEKVESKVVSIDDLEDEFDDDKKKKKKNKKKGKEEENQEENKVEADADANEGDEDEFTMKSAAQKKKEKKEREKQKKIEEKQKQFKKDQAKKEREEKEGIPAVDKKKEETIVNTPKEVETSDQHEATPEAEEEGEESKSKKKKKKKGEKEKEEKKEEKKPNKKIAALKEALKQKKEEEERARQEAERLRLEEEERIRKLEEELKHKEELKRLKKQAKKDREAQLKKEGKFLTEKQKQDKRKVEQMLEAMKLSGMEVGPRPATSSNKKAMVYGKRKDPRKGNKEKSPSNVTTPSEESPSTELNETIEDAKKEAESTEENQKEEEKEDVKDEWDAESDEEEEESEESQTEKPSAPEVKESEAITESKEEEDDDEEEEDEDEEDEEESSEESEESESDSEEEEKTPIDLAREKIQKRAEKADKARSIDHLRAPVVCVLGHVDTGKTKILDKLRRTNVQDGEAGGITQQIGATNVPKEAVMDKTKMVKEFAKQELKLPGLLIIDTPGHESFSNLRLRGSSLCDIAILVIDIMHGLEPQTIESIKLLKERRTPFIVALNKIDRLYQWKPQPMLDVQNTLKKQTPHTKAEFDERTQQVILQLAEEGLNAAVFYENKNPREYVSMVPTSAHTGDGMGNLVALVCELCQTMLAKRLMYSTELQATVMEVKAITGMGTTIDVILINGSLKEGDTIVLAGTEGPIITQIRGLLMPQPMKELRVKNQYEHHKTVMAAQGVKINAKDMEKCLAGLPLYVAHDNDEKEYYKAEVATVLKDTLESIKVQDRGVFVQASTLGSLEALLEFLRTSKIPYAGINIGPVHKKDIMRASVMLEHDSQYAVILAFDVKVEREAQELADNLGVRIFTAEIIYHLFDAFTKYREDLKKQKQEEFKHIAVFPCKLRVLPQYIFNSRDPIVMGVSVEAGFVKEGTPICVPTKEFVDIGRVASLELNHKQIDVARQGQEICIKIVPTPGEAPKMYGRHFEDTDLLVSKISRQSIDAVKDYFRDEMTKPDWRLMVELKKQFEIL